MIPANSVLRIARPTDRLAEISRMYVEGLGFALLAEFQDHDGFDGAIIGHPHQPYHLEFTAHAGVRAGNAPTKDNLLVFYVPDRGSWLQACANLLAAGFIAVPAYNKYWDQSGKTFEDPDGYRVVLQNSPWDA